MNYLDFYLQALLRCLLLLQPLLFEIFVVGSFAAVQQRGLQSSQPEEMQCKKRFSVRKK